MSDEKDTLKGPAATSMIAEKLRGVCVGTRDDLDVARHLFRGKPAYVIRDPLTFQSYKLDLKGYAIFTALVRDRPLADIFRDLVDEGTLSGKDEDSFYQAVLSLHRLNFLNLPISDDQRLYQRYLAWQRQRRKEKLMSIFFLRIPLVNPNAFLDRTIRYTRFLFSKWFFGFWALCMALAGFLAIQGFDQLIAPVQGVLTAKNIPFMFGLLIGLKVIHEFGHAYACKHFGGHVPEMGVFLVVFAPMAYVDATASWGFSRKAQRLMVGLGGMYFESLVACGAVFVFFLAEPGMVRDMAYNVIFLAGVATVLFNLNPLMRYDGYYILGDTLEIPNLRQRATEQVTGVLKRMFLGIRGKAFPGGLPLRAFLVVFGTAAAMYRVVIVTVICGAIATKLFLVGIVLAGIYLLMTVVGVARKTGAYLFFSDETAGVRFRAACLGLSLFAGVPLGLVFLKLPGTVHSRGVLISQEECVIHAGMDGTLEMVGVTPGDEVGPDHVIATLINEDCGEAVAVAEARLEAAKIRYRAYQALDLSKAAKEKKQVELCLDELRRRRADAGKLEVTAETGGRVIDGVDHRDEGRFVMKGDPLFTLISGPWQVKAVFTEDDFVSVKPREGDRVEVKTAARSGETLTGVIRRIVPRGSRLVSTESFTQKGGGDIAVNPVTGEASQPFFEVYVGLDDQEVSWFRQGMTCRVRCRGEEATLGTLLTRRVRLFVSRLMQG